jgi:hypothetical protein
MNARSLLRLWLVVAALPLASGAPPEWLKPCLTEEALAWRKKDPVVRLLDYAQVHYTAIDRVKLVIRGALQVNVEESRGRAVAQQSYIANSTRILAARAWLVSADGKKTRSYGRYDFIDLSAQFGDRFWDALRVLSYAPGDALELGGVLAWEFEVELPPGVIDTQWTFIANLPVFHSYFEVTPIAGGRLDWLASSTRINPPVPGSEPGALRWEMTKTLPPMGSRPSGYLNHPRTVSVRCLPPGGTGGPPQTWSDLARLIAKIIEPKIETGGELAAKATALTTGKTERWDRIRALSEFVQKEFTYLSVTLDKDALAGYRPHPATEVLRNHYGDCKDKATLLVALLRAIGENGFVVLVNTERPKSVAPDWPGLVFNHAIVALPTDAATPAGWPVGSAGALGRFVFFDPTDPDSPLGTLRAEDRDCPGLIIAPQGAELLQTPAIDPAHDGLERRMQAKLDAFGRLQAQVEETRQGAAGARYFSFRAALRGEKFNRWMEGQLHDTIPLIKVTHWSDDWDPIAARHHLSFDFAAEKFGRSMGNDLLLFIPHLVPLNTTYAPWRANDLEGNAWFPAMATREEIHFLLPEGATLVEKPDDWSMKLPTASCRLSYRLDGREIVYSVELSRQTAFYEKTSYEALRAFYQKVVEAQRRPILLRCTAPAPTAP